MGQKSRYALPIVPEPPDTICFLVRVPNDPFYLAAFRGALYGLSKPYVWENDPTHKALRAGARMLQMWNELQRDPFCGNPPSTAGVEIDDMSRFRIDPLDCTIIQIECQPDQWEQFYPPKGCKNPSGIQPGPAPANPGPGETITGCFELRGNDKFILPTAVSEGDVLTVHDSSGGWNDGTLIWYCPDGSHFIANGCAPLCSHSVGDPSASACHMSLIALINGVYYATDAPIVIPPGLSNEAVVFQANDGTLNDNAGSISFCVDHANKSQKQFHHVWDFLTADGGWLDEGCTPYFGNWVSGTGWTEGAVQNLGIVKFGPVGTVITKVRIVTTGIATYNAKLYTTAYPGCGGANTLYIDHAPGDFTVDTNIVLTAGQPALNFHQDANSAGDAILARLEVWGPGDDPF